MNESTQEVHLPVKSAHVVQFAAQLTQVFKSVLYWLEVHVQVFEAELRVNVELHCVHLPV